MAYTKNTWETGDIVSSQKLNHMEDGIAGAYEVMVINESTDGIFDKTWQEIYDAMAQGKMCVVRVVGETTEEGITNNTVTSAFSSEGKYMVVIGGSETYTASSATGYPEYGEGSGDNA